LEQHIFFHFGLAELFEQAGSVYWLL
jgi:hypothetical protein